MEKITNTAAQIVDKIENFLGERSKLLERIISDDENDAFPTEALKWIEQGILKSVSLKKHNGEFTTLHDLFWLSRLVARRNLTSAIALGQTFLGTLPIYIAGDDFLKELASKRLSEGGLSCLALTEENHGSDIGSTETFYDDEKLSGKKWCINNATRGKTQAVIVQTKNGLSFIYIDKENLPKESYSNIEKIKTHGIKGADISGITFHSTPIPKEYIIGREGKGLEILQKTMQVSRTFCTTFSIGSLEACLKETYDFASNRNLYNKPIIEMDTIKNELKKSYLTLLVTEAIGLSMTRFITTNPEVMSLYSATAKYLVPEITTHSIESLCAVVGARAYLRQDTYAILEKYRRDHKVVSIFDGSNSVNLSIIARQFKNIKRHLTQKPTSEFCHSFDMEKEWASFTGQGLILSNRGHDIVFCTYFNYRKFLNQETQHLIDSQLKELEHMIDNFSQDTISTAAQKIAIKYVQCLSACLYVSFFEINKKRFNQYIQNDSILPQLINLIFNRDIDFDNITLNINNNKLISHWDFNTLE